MIFVRIFIDQIPDEWNAWYLVALETLIEALVISFLIGLWRASGG